MTGVRPWNKVHIVSGEGQAPAALSARLAPTGLEVRQSTTLDADSNCFQIHSGLKDLNSSVFLKLESDGVFIACEASAQILTQADVWDDLMAWSALKT